MKPHAAQPQPAASHANPSRPAGERPGQGPRPPRSAGFTLLEMLVVVMILMVLVSIGVTLGPAIASQGNEQMTLTVLNTAESIRTEYRARTGRNPNILSDNPYPLTVLDRSRRAEFADDEDYLPIADNRADFEDHSIERFVARTLELTVVSRTNTDVVLRDRSSINQMYQDLGRDIFIDEDRNGFMELRDGWGNRLVYVPPGAPFGDNATGHLPWRSSPYFASPGPSGNFGSVHPDADPAEHEAAEDNLYSFELGN